MFYCMKPFSSVGLASHLMTRMCLFVQYADKTQHVGSMPSTGQHGGILERLEELSKRLFYHSIFSQCTNAYLPRSLYPSPI